MNPADQPIIRYLNLEALNQLLAGLSGAKIVSFEARTEPTLLAKHPQTREPNPLRFNVVKFARVNGVIGWCYQRTVNRQRAREGQPADFVAEERKWGRRIPGSPLVEHGGQYFLEVKIERSLGHRYETLDGEPLEAAAVERFLPRRSSSRQGVEREVILRDYALASLVWLKLDGVTYVNSDQVSSRGHAIVPSKIPA